MSIPFPSFHHVHLTQQCVIHPHGTGGKYLPCALEDWILFVSLAPADEGITLQTEHRCLPIVPGGALLLPPQLCHVLSVIQAPCLMLCFSAAAEQQMVFEFPPLQNTPAWPLLLLIRSEQTARNAKTPLLQALLLQMSALSPTSLAPSPSGGGEFPLPFAMLQHLNAHFTEDLSLSELSEQFHVSTSHMIHVFKAQFGLTPIQYVIRRRIGEAQHLLRTTEDSAGDIAGRVGMVNRNYFYRMFKRLVELSPVQYREVTCGQPEEHASR